MRDDQLVAQILAGNTAQFEALVDRYLPMVRGLCRSRVANASSHDDLVQEVFLQGYLQLDRLRDRARFGPWLARIAGNQCYSWLRGQGRRLQLDTDLASEAPRVAPSPDVEAMRRETVDWVRQAIARLPEKIRDAMTLFYVEGLTVSEAARCLEIRESALRKRLQYGRKSVGEELFAHLEPQTLPESEKREQKARVLAALPLATVPWKTGAAAGTTWTGLAVLTKLALVTLPVAVVVVAVVAAGTSWRPAWPGRAVAGGAERAAVSVVASTTAPKESPQPKNAAPRIDAADTGDLALTAVFRTPDMANQKIEPPVAANTRLWLAPVHVNKERLSPLLREAGVDAMTADAALATLEEPRLESGSFATILSEAGLSRKQFEAVLDTLKTVMEKEGLKEDALFAPAYELSREAMTDAQGRCEFSGLAPGRYLISAEKPGAEKPLNISSCDGAFVQKGKRVERTVRLNDSMSAIQGTVVDAATGKPVEGVEVALSGLATMLTHCTSRSDAEGRFSFAYLIAGYGPFTLRATPDRYAPVTVSGERRPATPTVFEIRLGNPRAAVSGSVTNADGTPAPGVSIMREMVAGEGARGAATTDAEGRYSLPHDGGRLTLHASATNVASEKVTLELHEGEVATQDFVLSPGGGIAIDLRAPVERSVPKEIGSWVLLIHGSGCRGGIGLEQRDGLFRMDYLEPGDYSLVFAVKDYEGVRLDFQIPSPPKEQRFTVALKEPEGGVRVRVLDAMGRPKPDAGLSVHVTQSRYDDSGRKRWSASASFNYDKPEGNRTDANGECLLQGLPPGEYKVMSGNAAAELSVPTDDVVVLRMEPVGEPAGPATAYLDKKMIRPVDEAGAELPLGTDPIELFIVTASGTVSNSNVEAGHNAVYAILGGHTAGVASVDLSKETFEERRQNGFGANPVKPVFGAGGAITGTLIDEAGQPVADKKLAVLPAECFEAALDHWESDRDGWESLMASLAQGVKTQADGSFRIDFLPEGSYYVGSPTHCSVFPIEGNPVEVRRGADTGPITLIETADDKIRCP